MPEDQNPALVQPEEPTLEAEAVPAPSLAAPDPADSLPPFEHAADPTPAPEPDTLSVESEHKNDTTIDSTTETRINNSDTQNNSSSASSPTTSYQEKINSSHAPAATFVGSAGRMKSLEQRVAKRTAALSEIVAHVRTHGTITNDGIEKLLHVSDTTAWRYADLLVKQGTLVKSGKGRAVSYSLAA